MDAVGVDGYGDTGVGVDEEAGGVGRDGFEDLAGQQDEVERGQIFFAELNEIDAIGGPAGGLVDESGLLEAVVTGK